jgi:hypothetical protein
MKRGSHYLVLGVLLTCCVTGNSFGQFKAGADFYNRYVWRGVDFGNAPSAQPAITFTTGGFSVGWWAAYSLGSDATTPAYSEHDLWMGYTFETKGGAFTLLYTDYFYPSAGLPYFNFSDNGGSHTLEGGLSYTGPETFPITLSGYVNFRNDPQHSVYLYGGYPFSVEDYGLTLFVGVTPTKSAWYATTSKAGIINTGITLTKTIKITESFSLPVTASYVMNTVLEQTYLLFGVSL